MSKFPKKHWDKMNTNIFGSFSAWVKDEEHHTIFSFTEKHMDMLASLLVEWKTTMQSWERSIGPKTEDKLLHNIAKNETFSDGKAKISVDLRQHTCTCLAWQMSGIPCEHACAMIQKMNQDVYEFVDDWYHLFKQEMVYSGTLHPLEFQNLPTVHSDGNVHDPNGYVHVSLDPPVTKRCLGRPRQQRIRPNLENR